VREETEPFDLDHLLIHDLGGRTLSKKQLNVPFDCENCGETVVPLTNGSYRNHCPYCLYSKHMDILPGDRQSDCKGMMEPIQIKYHTKKGYQIVHKCLLCGIEKANQIAQNTVEEDNQHRLRMFY
jgi:RNHCP domain